MGTVALVNQSLSHEVKLSSADIKGEIDESHTKIKGTMASVNQSLSREVQQSSAEVKVKIEQSNTDMKGTMASVSASIKAESASIKASIKNDVKNQMDALQQSNTEMKGAVASLAAMVASLLRASGVETAVQFPTCTGPALHSFGRYVKGRVPSRKATLVPGATASVCAAKCLEVAGCTAFSFAPGNDCHLASKGGTDNYEIGGARSNFYKRLAECQV